MCRVVTAGDAKHAVTVVILGCGPFMAAGVAKTPLSVETLDNVHGIPVYFSLLGMLLGL